MPTCRLKNNSVFIHVPKTAGTSVTGILDTLKLVSRTYSPPHPTLAELEPSPFRFAFVRHPWEWLMSQYRYMTVRGWTKGLWGNFAAPTFEDFLNRVYAENKPRVTLLWNEYLGPPGNRIEFIGRQENLMPDLEKALHYSGIDFCPVTLMKLEVYYNRSPDYPCPVPDELKRRVLRLERGIINEFYGEREEPMLHPLLVP